MEENVDLKTERIEWEAPEFLYRHKNVSWYWVSAIIAVIIFAFAWWQKNIFFGFFVVLAEVLLIYFGRQEPRLLKFSVSGQGIVIANEKNFSYDNLASFWVRSKNEEFKELIIKSKARFVPYIKILIDIETSGRVNVILKKHLPEEEYEDNLLDVLSELVGF